MVLKNILTWPFRAADSLIDRIVAVLGAIGFSQFPGFMRHYTQRLGGHLAEAERNLQTWRDVAAKAGIPDIQTLVHTYLSSDKVEVLEAGRKCAADVTRSGQLENALSAITSASPWSRPVAFMTHLDPDVARSTASDFAPNVPLDLESLIYAVVGLVLVSLVYAGLRRTIVSLFSRLGSRLRRSRVDSEPGPSVA
jgi:hypothetical protein